MVKTLELLVNGQRKDIEAGEGDVSLEDVIGLMELKADRVAVELNGGIVRRAGWSSTIIRSGDRLEVVHFVGGGAS